MTERRCGFVSLIGAPNVGKSTLLNRVVGAKVSIVTHKAQTTRFRIRGVALRDPSQIVFVDTPGLFAPRRRLDRAMVSAAWRGAADADILLLLAQAHRGLDENSAEIIDALKKTESGKRPRALAINKIDLVRRSDLLDVAGEFANRMEFDKVFMISARDGSGVEDLVEWLAETIPSGPWLYPADQIADIPVRMMAAETTREKLMLRLHEELPYNLTVETESWQGFRDGSVRIDQVIYVAKASHKGIVLGQSGQTAKQVGSAARKELEEFLGRRVHLFLQVKVRTKWMDDARRYRVMGLDMPGGQPKGGIWPA